MTNSAFPVRAPNSTQAILDELREFESRNVTFIDPDGSWPIVWDRAKGNFVWDLEGKRYLDLTAAFGVAAAGHANSRVVRAGQRQMSRLLHAMGDVHPHALKAHLAREISSLTFGRWSAPGRTSTDRANDVSLKQSRGKTIFCNSGFEAVEAALKTALLATGKPGVIAFRDGYHGLGYGALNATHRDHFRLPFLEQLGEFGCFVDFPRDPLKVAQVGEAIGRWFKKRRVGAILVEPVQVRGGINIPAPEFLPMLRQICDTEHALLILDEIYTGFGRTGTWFACEHWKVLPDVICLGKALTGGFPLAACVGRADLMDLAWPPSNGEAIHTSTFLGHPVGCAMALAQIREIRERRLPERAAKLGRYLLDRLSALESTAELQISVRGLGLLAGLELQGPDGTPASEKALKLVKSLLKEGYILLPEGEYANVVSFTPPLTITTRQIDRVLFVLKSLLELSQSQTQHRPVTAANGQLSRSAKRPDLNR